MAATRPADVAYLGGSELDLAVASDDLRGMVVVDPNGHRLGEVDDLVVDVRERRARLLSVVSGGILGLEPRRRLIPVETIAKVDDRVHVLQRGGDGGRPSRSATEPDGETSASPPGTVTLGSCAAAYQSYDVVPFWDADHIEVHVPLR